MENEEHNSRWQTMFVIGRRYRVEWDDCCTAGSFESVATAYVWSAEAPGFEEWLDGVQFENGVFLCGPEWGLKVKELP